MIYFNYEKDTLSLLVLTGIEADGQPSRFIHQFADKDKIRQITVSTLSVELISFWLAP